MRRVQGLMTTAVLVLGLIAFADAQPAAPPPPPGPYPGVGQPSGPPPSPPYPIGAQPVPVAPGLPAMPNAPQIPASQGSPSVVGQVQLYLLNPDGEVDGFLLSDGTEVKFPPHLAATLTAMVRPGSSVSVVGFFGNPTAYGRAVPALSVTNTATGQTVVDQPPASPPPPPYLRRLARSPLTVSGTVARFLVNPPGDVDGLLLTSGEQVRFPPHNGVRVVTLLGGRAGSSITANGYGTRNAFGSVVEADSLTINGQTVTLRWTASRP